MDNRAVVKRIMKNLDFEVESVSNNKSIQDNSTSSKFHPTDIKIKVRKKEVNDHYNRGFISNNQSEPARILQKVRLVSSDGTIMSFDMFMEEDEIKTSRKPRKHIFEKLNPGICLGATADDDNEPYVRNVKDTDNVSKNDSVSKSDGKLRHQFTLSKNDSKTFRMSPVKRTERTFLGQKCKPGGCLDPPFGEDRYSYKPATESPVLHDSKDADVVHLQEAPMISKLKAEVPRKSKRKSKDNEILINPEDEKVQKSVSDLSSTDSISDSVITYPPGDINTETKTRVSSEVKLRWSINESTNSFFSQPKGKKKDYTNHVQRDSSHRNFYIPKSTKDKQTEHLPSPVLPLPVPITDLNGSKEQSFATSNLNLNKQEAQIINKPHNAEHKEYIRLGTAHQVGEKLTDANKGNIDLPHVIDEESNPVAAVTNKTYPNIDEKVNSGTIVEEFLFIDQSNILHESPSKNESKDEKDLNTIKKKEGVNILGERSRETAKKPTKEINKDTPSKNEIMKERDLNTIKANKKNYGINISGERSRDTTKILAKEVDKVESLTESASKKNDTILLLNQAFSEERKNNDRETEKDDDIRNQKHLTQTKELRKAGDTSEAMSLDYADFNKNSNDIKGKEIVEILSISEKTRMLGSNFSKTSKLSEKVKTSMSLDSSVMVPFSTVKRISANKTAQDTIPKNNNLNTQDEMPDPDQLASENIDLHPKVKDITYQKKNVAPISGNKTSQDMIPIYKHLNTQDNAKTKTALDTIPKNNNLNTQDEIPDPDQLTSDNIDLQPKVIAQDTIPKNKNLNTQDEIPNPDQLTSNNIDPHPKVIDITNQKKYVTPISVNKTSQDMIPIFKHLNTQDEVKTKTAQDTIPKNNNLNMQDEISDPDQLTSVNIDLTNQKKYVTPTSVNKTSQDMIPINKHLNTQNEASTKTAQDTIPKNNNLNTKDEIPDPDQLTSDNIDPHPKVIDITNQKKYVTPISVNETSQDMIPLYKHLNTQDEAKTKTALDTIPKNNNLNMQDEISDPDQLTSVNIDLTYQKKNVAPISGNKTSQDMIPIYKHLNTQDNAKTKTALDTIPKNNNLNTQDEIPDPDQLTSDNIDLQPKVIAQDTIPKNNNLNTQDKIPDPDQLTSNNIDLHPKVIVITNQKKYVTPISVNKTSQDMIPIFKHLNTQDEAKTKIAQDTIPKNNNLNMQDEISDPDQLTSVNIDLTNQKKYVTPISVNKTSQDMIPINKHLNTQNEASTKTAQDTIPKNNNLNTKDEIPDPDQLTSDNIDPHPKVIDITNQKKNVTPISVNKTSQDMIPIYKHLNTQDEAKTKTALDTIPKNNNLNMQDEISDPDQLTSVNIDLTNQKKYVTPTSVNKTPQDMIPIFKHLNTQEEVPDSEEVTNEALDLHPKITDITDQQKIVALEHSENVNIDNMESDITDLSGNGEHILVDRVSHSPSLSSDELHKKLHISNPDEEISNTLTQLRAVTDKVVPQSNAPVENRHSTDIGNSKSMVITSSNEEYKNHKTSQTISPNTEKNNKQMQTINPNQDINQTIEPMHKVRDSVGRHMNAILEQSESVNLKNVGSDVEYITNSDQNMSDFKSREILTPKSIEHETNEILEKHENLNTKSSKNSMTVLSPNEKHIKKDRTSQIINLNAQGFEKYEEISKPDKVNYTVDTQVDFIDSPNVSKTFEPSEQVNFNNRNISKENILNNSLPQIMSPERINEQPQILDNTEVPEQAIRPQNRIISKVDQEINGFQMQNEIETGISEKRISVTKDRPDDSSIQADFSNTHEEAIRDYNKVLRSGPTVTSMDSNSIESKIIVHRILQQKDAEVISPSDNTVTSDKRTISLDLTFQSYLNENNERIIKTVVNENENARYPNDSVATLKSQMKLSTQEDSIELKIPVDSMFDMTIKVKSNDHEQVAGYKIDTLSDKTKMKPVSPFLLSAPTEEAITERKNQEYEVDAQEDQNDLILYSKLTEIYEKELLPLQTMIKALKSDVDNLVQQRKLKKKVICSKKSSYRNTKPCKSLYRVLHTVSL